MAARKDSGQVTFEHRPARSEGSWPAGSWGRASQAGGTANSRIPSGEGMDMPGIWTNSRGAWVLEPCKELEVSSNRGRKIT